MKKTSVKKTDNRLNNGKENGKTFIGFLQPAHDKLGDRFNWYYLWHKYPYHRQTHYSILIASTIGVILAIGVLALFEYPVRTAYAPLSQISYEGSEGAAFHRIKPIEPGSMLFDIRLDINSSSLDKASDLVAQVKFNSFGNVPTPVDLTYKINKLVDPSGIGVIEVYSDTGKVTVETEKLITKDFKNLDLEGGKYSLVLTTVYGDGVRDEFKQDFEIKEAFVSKEKMIIAVKVVFILAIAGLSGIIIFRFMKRKKK